MVSLTDLKNTQIWEHIKFWINWMWFLKSVKGLWRAWYLLHYQASEDEQEDGCKNTYFTVGDIKEQQLHKLGGLQCHTSFVGSFSASFVSPSSSRGRYFLFLPLLNLGTIYVSKEVHEDILHSNSDDSTKCYCTETRPGMYMDRFFSAKEQVKNRRSSLQRDCWKSLSQGNRNLVYFIKW